MMEKMMNNNNRIFGLGFEYQGSPATGVDVALSNTDGFIPVNQLESYDRLYKESIKKSWSGNNELFKIRSTDPLETFTKVSSYRVDTSFERGVFIESNWNKDSTEFIVPVNYREPLNIDEKYPIIYIESHSTNSKPELWLFPFSAVKEKRVMFFKYWVQYNKEHPEDLIQIESDNYKAMIPCFGIEARKNSYKCFMDDEGNYKLPRKIKQLLFHLGSCPNGDKIVGGYNDYKYYPLTKDTCIYNGECKSMVVWNYQIIVLSNNSPDTFELYQGLNKYGEKLFSSYIDDDYFTMVRIRKNKEIIIQKLYKDFCVMNTVSFSFDFRPVDENGKIDTSIPETKERIEDLFKEYQIKNEILEEEN